MSRREEYLKAATSEDTLEEQAEQMQGHLDEGPQAPPAPHPARAARRHRGGHRSGSFYTVRSARSEEGHSAREPSAGHTEGVPDFPAPLPGEHGYVAHPAAQPHPPLDVGPAKPYYSGGMAHGVPAAPAHGGRPAPKPADRTTREATGHPLPYGTDHQDADPIPVYVVQRAGGVHPLRRASFQTKQVPVATDPPLLLAGKDPKRTSVKLLNEHATNTVRLTFDPGSPASGVLLPAAMTSYLEIATSDEIWAATGAGGSGTSYVSIISQYEVADGA